MSIAEQQGRLRLIPGLNNPEDLMRLEGTDWVLTSNLGDRRWASGGFYLVDVRSRSHEALRPDFSGPPQAPYAEDPPDPSLFSAHGIDVLALGDGRFRVWAVNHGGRHSIEVFDLDARPSRPLLTWIGGVTLPDSLSGNAVVHLPDDAFAVTVTIDSRDPDAMAKAHAGQPCGLVLEWAPDQGWVTTPGSEVSGNNGVVASDDGRWLYIAAYTESALYRLSRGQTPYVRDRVALGFLADNIRVSPNASLVVTGHQVENFQAIVDCNRSGVTTCPAPTAVAKVDPQTLRAELLFVEPPSPDFGGGTSAIVVGEDLWIGTFRGQCLATIPLRDLGDPDL